MILDFETYCLNETSIKSVKKVLHGVLNSKNRAVMRKLLRKHVVFFKFRKKDGSLRRAVGTLISSFLPDLRGGAPKPEHQMVYYDLEKEHWRSFRSFSFIKIIDVKSKDEYMGVKKHKPIKKKEEEKHHSKEIEKKVEKHHDDEKHKEKKVEKKIDKHHDDEKDKKKEKEDIKKKEYDVGEKIPEKELMRRSVDFRKDSRKNKFTKKSNDAHKKGELDDKEEIKDKKKDKDKD